MPWNNPSDIETGQQLTTTVWNNLLGTSGSLKSVYDQVSTANRHVVVHKTTDLVFSGADVRGVNWNLIITDFANQQYNFPATVLPAPGPPTIEEINLPEVGMYFATFQYRSTVSTSLRFDFIVSDSNLINRRTYGTHQTPTANVLSTVSAVVYCPAISPIHRISLRITTGVATTITSALPSATDGSMVLTIAKL